MPTRPPIHRPYKPSAPVKRASAHERGYGDPRWEATRVAVFRRDGWRCQKCGGMTRKGTKYDKSETPHCDHIIAVSGKDDPLFYEMSNLRTLHHRCHSSKTASVDGGFGNPKRKPN